MPLKKLLHLGARPPPRRHHEQRATRHDEKEHHESADGHGGAVAAPCHRAPLCHLERVTLASQREEPEPAGRGSSQEPASVTGSKRHAAMEG